MRLQKISNIATCWKIILKNKKILYFTDADQDISLHQELYLSGYYFTPGAIFSSNELAQDNFTVSGTIDDKFISAKAILSGDFEQSYTELFLVDLSQEKSKKIILKTGWFGSIKYSKNKFTVEILSLGSKTTNNIGKSYCSSCRADFGDIYCKINKEKYSIKGEVSALDKVNSFVDYSRIEADDYFSNSVLLFNSGSQQNYQYNILNFYSGKITLDSVALLDIQIGDQYTIFIGCDKSLNTCINKFNNALNFRGEPYIPSRHKLTCS
jgi:uncharacterized phage protein (TIGR02218 family)